ncbi:MAG: TonB-dependent receptor [Prevotella sp.]|nr:TonB-dependent receptor [Prevotella sp.]MDY4218038.1 TonB-dependent receptor [Prevotella sp.]
MLNILFLAPLLLSGQPETPTDSTGGKVITMHEVVVTDFKQNPRNLTPTAVSRATTKHLQAHELLSPKELTAIMPNFYMPDYGSRANTPVFIRGIGAKAKASAVGYYIDGVPNFDNSAFDISLFDAAEVQVLRGPQGTLYGRNAIGGIINVFTPNPLNYQATNIKLGYGRFNDINLQASHYSKLNEQFGISASTSYHHNDGAYHNDFLKEKVDKINETQNRLGFYWQPNMHWTFRLNTSLAYSDQGGYPYAPYDLQSRQAQPISYNRYSHFRRLISSTGFNAQYTDNRISFNSQSAYQFLKTNLGIDQDFTTADRFFVINRYLQNMYTQELTLKSAHKGRYQWIVGAFGMLLHSNQMITNQMLAANALSFTHTTTPTLSLALYHQSSYNLWRGLSVTAGLRFDYERSKCTYFNYKENYKTLSKTGTEFQGKNHFRQITPKFSLQYLTTKQHLYYANITRGYKAGGVNTIFEHESQIGYNPEYSWNYEVGARNHFFNGRLTTEIDFFYIDWRDMQTSFVVPGKGTMLTNAGHTSSKGMEFSLIYRPFKNMEWSLAYGYTKAKYLDYRKNAKEDYTDRLLPMVPNHTLALNGLYTFRPIQWFDKITLSAGMKGLGRIYWADDNQAFQNFYATLHAKASFSKGIFTWEIWGKNLTNTRYVAYGFKSGKNDYAQEGRPMTWGMSIVLNF